MVLGASPFAAMCVAKRALLLPLSFSLAECLLSRHCSILYIVRWEEDYCLWRHTLPSIHCVTCLYFKLTYFHLNISRASCYAFVDKDDRTLLFINGRSFWVTLRVWFCNCVCGLRNVAMRFLLDVIMFYKFLKCWYLFMTLSWIVFVCGV